METTVWQCYGNPGVIECPTSVLEGVHNAISCGFLSFPRGGVEVGGVFFGEMTGDRLCIRAWLPIPCEHSSGPSFHLSEHDEARLAAQLNSARLQNTFKDMVPIGWFRTRNRSELCFTSEDAIFHQRHFGERWQFAAVFRPRYTGSTTAAIYRVGPDGECHRTPQTVQLPAAASPHRWRRQQGESRQETSRSRRAALRLHTTGAQPETPAEALEPSTATARANRRKRRHQILEVPNEIPAGNQATSYLMPPASGLRPDKPDISDASTSSPPPTPQEAVSPVLEEPPPPVLEEVPSPVLEESPAPVLQEVPPPVLEESPPPALQEPLPPVLEESPPTVQQELSSEEPEGRVWPKGSLFAQPEVARNGHRWRWVLAAAALVLLLIGGIALFTLEELDQIRNRKRATAPVAAAGTVR